MKKWLLIAIIFGVAFVASAETKLKDVPDDHWAAEGVYDLVKMGVTNGYPDGTFRGNKPITRYETAIFLSKLAKAIGGEDLKADLKALKDQIVEIKKTPPGLEVAGNYLGAWKTGNDNSSSGPQKATVADYRLMLTTSRELSEDARMKVNLDTMDYGFYDDGSASTAGRGLLASELLDLETSFKIDNVDLKVTYGPGPKQHAADPTQAIPSEVGVTYWRPNTGVMATTHLLGAEVGGGLFSRQTNTFDSTGKVNTGWLRGIVSYNFNRLFFLDSLKVDVSGDYLSKGLFSSTDRSIKAGINLFAPLGEKAEVSAGVGLGSSNSRMMAKGSVALKDPLDTGTVMTIKVAKVGSEYITPTFAAEEFDFAGYDYFNRPLESGTVNVGGELLQQVSDRARFFGRGDLRLNSEYKYEGPKARLTAEGGLSYNLAPNVNLDLAYRVHRDRGLANSSDLTSLGLMYRF